MQSTRIVGLDLLRSSMMMLGLFMHSSLTYGLSVKEFWHINDINATNIFFDIAALFIHYFRMPVFFLLGGFFGALLYHEKGGRYLLLNRTKRILIPAIVSNIILWPLIILSHFYAASKADITNELINRFHYENTISYYLIPRNSFNLWFLYYYYIITIIFWTISRYIIFKPKVFIKMKSIFIKIIQNQLFVLILFPLPIMIVLLLFHLKFFETPPDFTLDIPSLIFYMLCYSFGWFLYKNKNIFQSLSLKAGLFVGAGIILFGVKLITITNENYCLSVFLNSYISVLLVLGLTGLANRIHQSYSPIIQYLSYSSYWIYLIHVPIVIFLSGFLIGFHLNVFIKFTIVLTLTFMISILSYHFLVRGTFIGKYLNGKKF
jgi:glucan biosynthesis protein C